MRPQFPGAELLAAVYTGLKLLGPAATVHLAPGLDLDASVRRHSLQGRHPEATLKSQVAAGASVQLFVIPTIYPPFGRQKIG